MTLKLPIFFVKSQVGQDGSATLIGARAGVSASGEEIADEFQRFYNATGSSRINMTVKRYSEHLDWGKRWRRNQKTPD